MTQHPQTSSELTGGSGLIERLDERHQSSVVDAAAGLGGGRARGASDGFAWEGDTVDHDSPRVAALGAASEQAIGARPALIASTATTDARSFALYAGSPAVCFGPHAESIHGIDERVSPQSVIQTAQTLALFIDGWCGLERR